MPEAPASNAIVRPLDWQGGVRDLLAAWPVHVPLLALVSDDPDALGEPERRARWSIFARGDGPRVVIPADASPDEACRALSETLDAGRTRVESCRTSDRPPFAGGWIVALGYELGLSLEPAAARACERDPVITQKRSTTPQAILSRCDAAYAHDGATGRWWVVGDARAARRLPPLEARMAEPGPAVLGGLRSRTGRRAYEAAVAHVVRAIHEGELFQANLAHALRCEFEGSPRAMFRRLLDAARPAFGACLEYPSRERLGCVLSVSPELFLLVDHEGAARRVRTRPIKGTRPAKPGAAAELLHSRKDEAELAMITDLMRNDLGRVCAPGTVRVDESRALEQCADGSLLHTVSAISGRLRDGATNLDLLRATFPPGSITGAPKVRAMQLIRALESRPRGFYCGAIGAFSDDGRVSLSVAIRTATLSGMRVGPGLIRGRMDFPVGAGIVADSDPATEWAETLAKASALRRVRSAESPSGARGHV